MTRSVRIKVNQAVVFLAFVLPVTPSGYETLVSTFAQVKKVGTRIMWVEHMSKRRNI